MNIKVGKWYNKLNKMQQEELLRSISIEINKYGTYTINDKRKFLNAAFKTFGDNILKYNALKGSVTLKNGNIVFYNSDFGSFSIL